MVFISKEENDIKSTDIKKLIHDEFKISVTDISSQVDTCQFAFASNKNKLPMQVEFEGINIIGDISLHNKSEIIQKYNLNKRLDISTQNEELVSLLYKEKGITFIKDLIGEFSFIIYDKNNGKVYAVRDQMGVKTLFWIRLKSGYVFASDIFLLKYLFSPNDINDEYFKEYHIRNGIIDTEITPYKNVYRIPSGSYMYLNTNISKVIKYWDLADVHDTIVYKNETDYYEEFEDLLYSAVKDRLIRGKENSILMSGGLDSTSIYGLSKRIEKEDNEYFITPVSAVFDELKESDEKEYIYELLNKYQEKGIFKNFDNILLFENFPYSFPFSYEPNVNSLSFNLTFNIVKESVNNGLFNILTGYAGDHLLTGSLYVTRDFFTKGRFKQAFSYITDFSIKTNTSALQNISNYTLFPNILEKYHVNSNSQYYNYLFKKLRKIKYYHQKNLYFQISQAKAHLYTDRLIGAIAQADIKHPYLDKRLVEFIYKIPGELCFSNDSSKFILRKSMNKYLTEKVINRVNKTTHLAYTYKSIRNNWGHIYRIMENPIYIKQLNLISNSRWNEELKKWRNGVMTDEDFWTLFAIESWFVNFNKKLNND